MARLSRRSVLIGGAAVAGAAAIASRPGDNSGPRDGYFIDLQNALHRAGIAMPTLIIDKARLDANIAALSDGLPTGMGYRVVTKSLPSRKLIEHVMAGTGTNRLMTFNLPMLIEQARRLPDADQLLGKPMPATAAAQFLDNVRNQRRRDQVQWLIDTPERLAQYSALAKEADINMRLSLEIDVGLHRGGFSDASQISAAVATIEADPNLSFAGIMGYEAHVSGHPTLLGLRDKALNDAWDKYEAARQAVQAVLGNGGLEGKVLNAAGSPTFRMYRDTSLANEVSVGSALVKPGKFDLDTLEVFQAAAFIATPVLKTYNPTELPLTGLEFVNGLQQSWDPNTRKTVFIHGGYWKAHPVDPPGLQTNGIWGHSSNQEMLNGGENLDLAVDDFVFLRPDQSEAIFLQFGDIALYENEEISDFWPVYEASA